MNESIFARLKRRFQTVPKWAEDFPVEAADDTTVSRRDFVRYLFLVSSGIFTGTLAVVAGGIFTKRRNAGRVEKAFKIADAGAVPVGTSRVFPLPHDRGPAIMVRLSEDRYVAYSQKCTHLQCPVLWRSDENKLVCPCHKGAFEVETGRVLYGPPERPLPQVRLEVKDDGVYYAGM
jgi:cytochrome b6-f complex iron-sulfur subunit